MNSLYSPETPEQFLARAFTEHVLTWMRDNNRSDPVAERPVALLRDAACRLSLAVSSGHVCLPLSELADPATGRDVQTVRRQLLASGVVEKADAPGSAPLVLDRGNRLYLHRYFDYERALAKRLSTMCRSVKTDTATVRSLLDALFPSAKDNALINWQKIAVALALSRSLLIVSGGPGTGKTTTVAALLACLLESDPQNRVMLAAPTGKAAARMLEAIGQHASLFPLHLRPMVPKEARTLHRLLGMTGNATFFRYHAGHPLPLDTLVVDEASMLDLAMASSLFAALPPHARVILLGDRDQLSAVEAGSVFAELAAQCTFTERCRDDLEALTGHRPDTSLFPAVSPRRVPLADSVVTLTRNYRFREDSGIGKLACGIRACRTEETVDFLCSGRDASVRWIDPAAPSAASLVEKTLLTQYADYFACVRQNPENVASIFDTFNRSRILCAVREGRFGTEAVNRLMASALSGMKSARLAGTDDWFVGRPVMVRRNNYALRLFNGDVGIVLPDASGQLTVCFMHDDGRFRRVSPVRLGEHETSFAMTVHQSQGSEFDTVTLLLPSGGSRALCRELIYTGVTRAKKKLVVVAEKSVLTESLQNHSVRYSGLRARLGEMVENS